MATSYPLKSLKDYNTFDLERTIKDFFDKYKAQEVANAVSGLIATTLYEIKGKGAIYHTYSKIGNNLPINYNDIRLMGAASVVFSGFDESSEEFETMIDDFKNYMDDYRLRPTLTRIRTN